MAPLKRYTRILDLNNAINKGKNVLEKFRTEQTIWKRELVSSKIEI